MGLARMSRSGPNKTVTYTFAKAGVYPYACALHSGMSGVIVVGDVASTSAGGAIAGTTTGDDRDRVRERRPRRPRAPIELADRDRWRLVVASALAGAVVGASVIWLSTRRRTASAKEEAAGIA